MVDLKKQYRNIKPEVDEAIARVLESCQFIGGEEIAALEREVADFLGARHAIALASGTDALYLALWSLGIGAGDEVITTSFTFIATAEVIPLLGARPVFVDIDPQTYNIDPAQVEQAITERTKAILPVHLFGQPADCDPILDIATRHHLYVVEDAAQAIGAEYQGRKVCTIGTVGCLSFFPSKNLGAYGDGGMVVTDNDDLAREIHSIAQHGKGASRYENRRLGVNSRLDAIQAAILRVKLRYLSDWNRARRRNAGLYDALLKEVGVVTPYVAPGNVHVYHQYSIRVRNRDRIVTSLGEHGIASMIYYPIPLHLQEAFAYLHCRRGDFPIAERTATEILSLPMYPELTEEEIGYITDTIKHVLRSSEKPHE
jgi:dTDP-4-amino-4,6-dideoxygalactose transaminase